MKPDELEMLEKEISRLLDLICKELNADLEISAISMKVILDIGFIRITRNVIYTDHKTAQIIILTSEAKAEMIFKIWKELIETRNKFTTEREKAKGGF